MGRRRVGNRRQLAVGVLLLAVAGVTHSIAQASDGFSFSRFAGGDRYETAKAVAVSFAATSDRAILATGENYPDALAGSYLAGQLVAPIVLTRRDALPAPSAEALSTLQVKTVTVLGGAAAISESVVTDLKSKGYAVERVAGGDRYDTARRAATQQGSAPVGQVDGKPTAIVATGENFPDAVAVGPLAFAGKLPVLLTRKDTLSAETKTALAELGIKRVLLLGGTSAVSSGVETSLRAGGMEVSRFAGSDRTDTAAKLADLALGKLAFGDTRVNLARGDAFADALAAGPLGGKTLTVTLLTKSPTELGAPTAAWLNAHSASLASGILFGGESAISDAVKGQAEAAAGKDPDAPTVTISDGPADKASLNDGKPTFAGAAEDADGVISKVDVEIKATTSTVASAECTDCGTAKATWTFTPVNELAEGTYTLAFRATDGTGKVSEPVTRTLTVDKTGPKLQSVQATGESKTVNAVFDEPLDCTTVQRDDFNVRVGSIGSSIGSAPTAATCTGDAASTISLTVGTTPQTSTSVEVSVVDAMTDLAGNEAAKTTKTTTAGAPPPKPTISIADASGVETSGTTTTIEFLVTITQKPSTTVTVRYETGTTGTAQATAGEDYIVTSGTISFGPNSATTGTTFTVQIRDDQVTEPDETFAVNLSGLTDTGGTGTTITRAQAKGTIAAHTETSNTETGGGNPCTGDDGDAGVWGTAFAAPGDTLGQNLWDALLDGVTLDPLPRFVEDPAGDGKVMGGLKEIGDQEGNDTVEPVTDEAACDADLFGDEGEDFDV